MDAFFMQFLSTLASISDAKAALKMTSIVNTPEKVKAVETVIAKLKEKPKTWRHTYKVSDRGGCVLPNSVFLDADGGTTAIQTVIDALEKYKTDPAARSYSKG